MIKYLNLNIIKNICHLSFDEKKLYKPSRFNKYKFYESFVKDQDGVSLELDYLFQVKKIKQLHIGLPSYPFLELDCIRIDADRNSFQFQPSPPYLYVRDLGRESICSLESRKIKLENYKMSKSKKFLSFDIDKIKLLTRLERLKNNHV